MAQTEPARRLTEAHRLAQARIGLRTIIQMRAIWPLLDLEDLDRTAQRWLTAALPIVQSQRQSSANLAASYLATFKALEVGTATVPLVDAAPIIGEQVATSLLVTGPYALRRSLARATPLVKALSTAEATSAAAAMRHALNGGRDTVLDTVRSDRRAVGWARATSGRACAFCALLASRGAVYKETTVGFQAHDHCSCAAEPIYRGDAALPPGSERYADLYQQAKREDGDTLAAFRRLVAA